MSHIFQLRNPSSRAMTAFQGIRYATARRFHTPVHCLESRESHPKAPVCCPGISTQLSNEMGGEVQKKTEDCLTLDVWVPEGGEQYALPTYIWLPGGNFTAGSGNQPRFNAQHLANTARAVIVSVNYRVGIFGWPPYSSLPHLKLGIQDAPARDLGLHDIFAAIQWIKKNIHHYGGDSKTLFLAGQSAGAFLALEFARFAELDEISGLVLFGTPIGMPKRFPILTLRDQLKSIKQLSTDEVDQMQKNIWSKRNTLRIFSYFRPTLSLKNILPLFPLNKYPPILAVFNKDEASAWIDDKQVASTRAESVKSSIKRFISRAMTFLIFELPWHTISKLKVSTSCTLIKLDLNPSVCSKSVRTEHCMEIPIIFKNEENDIYMKLKNISDETVESARSELFKIIKSWINGESFIEKNKYFQKIF